MAKNPIVIIHSGASLADFAEQIEASINARFHSYSLSEACEEMSKGLSEAQLGELQTLAAHAAHAGGDNHPSDLYVNGVHIERRLG